MKAIQGDITKLQVDAIVNAANTSLLGGGGVDGAIHRAAGPDLVHECRLLGGCKTGEAKITKGYNLPAEHVIHTVGPVWNGGDKNEREKLASCYQSSLELAQANGLRSIVFPCISTGIYGFPKEEAAAIAVATATEFLAQSPVEMEITFCCFSAFDLKIYQILLID
jgi:O-acetyl-ADP-ribose deacetylase (regulator of RNase III)